MLGALMKTQQSGQANLKADSDYCVTIWAEIDLTCQHHLSRHEDQQHDLGHLHPVDQSWEQLRLILQRGREAVQETFNGYGHGNGGQQLFIMSFILQ